MGLMAEWGTNCRVFGCEMLGCDGFWEEANHAQI